MQASIYYLLPCSPLLFTAKTSSKLPFPSTTKFSRSIKLAASASSDAPQVDYTSMASSVFPAEACETLGGVACDVEMFPETKLRPEPPKPKVIAPATQTLDREYLEYDSPKTVFIAEACDDLGGEFCEPPYQTQRD